MSVNVLHRHRSYLQTPRHAITFAFQASATFLRVLLRFSPPLRPCRGEMDRDIGQALIRAGVNFSRQLIKAELHALYASLQPGVPPSNSTPPSKAANKVSQVCSVQYPRPEQTTTPLRIGLRPPGISRRPSASLGHSPDAAATSPQPQVRSAPIQYPSR